MYNFNPHIEFVNYGVSKTYASSSEIPGDLLSIGSGCGSLGWFGTYKFGTNPSPSKCYVTAAHVSRYAKENGYDIKVRANTLSPYNLVLTSNSLLNSGSNYYLDNLVIPSNYEYARGYGDFGFVQYDSAILEQSSYARIGSNSRRLIRDYVKVPPLTEQSIFKAVGNSIYIESTIKSIGDIYSPTAWIELGSHSAPLTFYNMVTVNVPDKSVYGDDAMFCVEGDSGCPVFLIENGVRSFCGIVSGGCEYGGLKGEGYFTSSYTLINAGFTPFVES